MNSKLLGILTSLILLSLFYTVAENQEAQSAQTWYFKWSCINVSGCRANSLPASNTEGPFESQTLCNSYNSQMSSAGGFRVESCYPVGSADTTTSRSQSQSQEQPTAQEMAPRNVIRIPDGKELYTYCGAAQGILKGSTREWYLGCCPRAYRILKSPSPTVQCGTEEARAMGVECYCYEKSAYCQQDKETAGICY